MLKDNMNGKICLVTGGTNGIGKSTAQELARMGATVVIVGRDAYKTSRVVDEIRVATGNKNVDSLLAICQRSRTFDGWQKSSKANIRTFMSCSTMRVGSSCGASSA